MFTYYSERISCSLEEDNIAWLAPMKQIINVNMSDVKFGLKPELYLMSSHKRSVVDTVSEEHTISDELKHFKLH